MKASKNIINSKRITKIMANENEDKVEVELSIDMPFLKGSIKTKTSIENSEAVMSSFLESLEKSSEKIKKIVDNLNSVAPIKTLAVNSAPVSNSSSSVDAGIGDEPMSNISNDLGVEIQKLKDAKIFAFKPSTNQMQLIGYNKFSPEVGTLAILYGFEIGLRKSAVSYEEANTIFQQCPYKVGTLANRVIPNIKKKLDFKKYESSKELVLTPGGLDDARKQILKALG